MALYDAAEHGAQVGARKIRDLTPEEMATVYSRPGYAGFGRWVGSYEKNPELCPVKVMGSWPDLGIYQLAGDMDAIAASSLWRGSCSLMSLDWRLFERTDYSPEEVEAYVHVVDCLLSLPAGFSGHVYQVAQQRRWGVSVCETVYEVEESTLRWRLEDTPWIHPSTYRFLVDASGHLLGILQGRVNALLPESQQPDAVAIPAAKLAVYPRGWLGRNWCGVSQLRPARYDIDAKRTRKQIAAETAKIAGPGYLDVTTEHPPNSPHRQALDEQLNHFETGKQRRITHDPRTKIEHKFGGSVLPDMAVEIGAHNSEIRTALDDAVQEINQGPYGARAAASELRASTHEAQAGEAAMLAMMMTRQIIVPLWSLQGLDIRRAPRIAVQPSGASMRDRTDQARLILEAIRDDRLSDAPTLDEAERLVLKDQALELLGRHGRSTKLT